MHVVHIRRTHTAAEMDSEKGKFSPFSCRELQGDFSAIDTSGEPILVCCRKVLTGSQATELADLLKEAATASDRRGPSAGPLDKIYPSCNRVNHYSMTKVRGRFSGMYNKSVKSGVVGYNKFGKPSAWTSNNPDKLKAVILLLQKLQARYQQQLPQAEAAQQKEVATRPHLPGTAFRTLYVNRNFRTALHKDCNVDASRYGLMTVLGENVAGGRIQFPEYGIEVTVGHGDLIMFKPCLWHCNTPLDKEGVRMSVVCHA